MLLELKAGFHVNFSLNFLLALTGVIFLDPYYLSRAQIFVDVLTMHNNKKQKQNRIQLLYY